MESSADLRRLQKVIGYRFREKRLLEMALTHPSYDSSLNNYERLEFLGDSILSAILTEELYRNFPDRSDGDLAMYRTALTNGRFLAELAREMEIGAFIRTKAMANPQQRDSIHENALEALIGAIFLDSKYAKVRRVILKWYQPLNERLDTELKRTNPKGRIQELICSLRPNAVLDYRLIAETGEAHERVYSVALYCEKELLGIGSGSSKKIAEKNAAFHALEVIFQRAKLQV
ncbi:MAG: ribonuclease III [Puniceicoccales bacterium]|jgi:ribonuclease-3|nr:ribonuclease III [Puniceicoccales bacterium]